MITLERQDRPLLGVEPRSTSFAPDRTRERERFSPARLARIPNSSEKPVKDFGNPAVDEREVSLVVE